MKRSEVREFLKAGVDAITPVLEFGSGVISDFNIKPDKTLPQVWQELTPVSGTNPNSGSPLDDWEVRLWIMRLDKIDSAPDQYEPLIDQCDYVAQQLMDQYNRLVSGYKLVTLTRRIRTPQLKKFAACLTGVLLTFTINSPDKTDLC